MSDLPSLLKEEGKMKNGLALFSSVLLVFSSNSKWSQNKKIWEMQMTIAFGDLLWVVRFIKLDKK